MGGLGDVEVGGDGVAGVFLFDVGEDGDVVCAESCAFTEEVAGVGFGEESFVGDGGVGEAFGADEGCAAGECDGEGGGVGAGEDLDAEGDGGGEGVADGGGDDGHCCGDFGADGAEEVGGVVHVFEDDGVEAGIGEGLGVADGGVDEVVGGLADPAGAAGRWSHVDHADGGAFGGEDVGGGFGGVVIHGIKIAGGGWCAGILLAEVL